MTATITADLLAAVHRITRQLDARGNPNLRGLPEVLLRGLKVQEEAGELAQALIGTLGQNPRKGHTHVWGDTVDEAIDVALSALVFAETALQFTGKPAGRLDEILAERLTYLAERAAASGAPDVAEVER